MTDPRYCPNCGTPAPDRYCPHCGQMQVERRVTMRLLLQDVFEDQLGLDDKAYRTFRTLLLRPGTLSIEYFAGRINRYITPFKLYLITALFFFLAAWAFTIRSATNISAQISSAMEAARTQAGNDTAKVSFGLGGGSGEHFYGLRLTHFPTDNWLRDAEVNFGIAPLNRVARRRLQDLSHGDVDQGSRELFRSIFDQIPKVLVLLLPVYSLLLYLFYRRSRRYFVEHFVFGLHLQAFFFLTFSLAWLPIRFIAVILVLWNIAYTLVAQHRFYQQSYWRVVAKSFVLSIAYMIFFFFGVLTSLALALTIG